MTDLTSAINLFEDVFINTAFFETFLITQLIILFGIMLFITREPRDWPILGFPVLVGMNAIGFYVNPILLGASGLIMVINGLSVEGIQGVIKTAGMATFGNVAGAARGAKRTGEFAYGGGVKPTQRIKSAFTDYREGLQESAVDKKIARLQRRDKIGTGVAVAQLGVDERKLSDKGRRQVLDTGLSEAEQQLDIKERAVKTEFGTRAFDTGLTAREANLKLVSRDIENRKNKTKLPSRLANLKRKERLVKKYGTTDAGIIKNIEKSKEVRHSPVKRLQILERNREAAKRIRLSNRKREEAFKSIPIRKTKLIKKKDKEIANEQYFAWLRRKYDKKGRFKNQDNTTGWWD